jgi:outer membrane protein with beta-barrel domain
MNLNMTHRLRGLLALACAGLIAGGTVLRAQPQADAPVRHSSLQFGVEGYGIINAPTASFTQLPGVDNCLGTVTKSASFEGGSGGGYGVGAVVSIKPWGGGGFASHIGGSAKVIFSSSSTKFEADEEIGQVSDSKGTLVPAISRYTVETKVTQVSLDPTVSYWIGAKLPLFFSVGAHLGYVLGGTYSQGEKLVSPQGLTYRTEGTTERNQNSGDLQQVSKIGGGVLVGVGYDLQVTPKLSIRPEVEGLFSLSAPVSGIDWKSHELHLGVSFIFTPPSEGPTPLREE